MTLQTDNGPTNAPSDLGTAWTTGLYATTRASSRFRVRVNQGGAPAWNHVYGFGKTGTLSNRNNAAANGQPYGTQCWDVGDNVEVSWTGFSADQTTTVEITLTPDGQTQTNITSHTIYPKHLNIPASLVAGKLVLQMPADTRIYIEVNGNRKDVLFVFSDPLAIDTVPTTSGTTITVSAGNIGSLSTVQGQSNGSPLVIRFPRGIWELPTTAGSTSNPGGAASVTRSVDHMLWPVRPFTKIHLERGAWVIGSFDIRNSNDISFSGPGNVSGEWATAADIDNTLQGTLLGNFNAQIAWAAFHGRTYAATAQDEDFTFPAMEVRGITLVGHPFYTFNLGISLCDRVKCISHWRPNTDGTNGLALDANTYATIVDKSLFCVGDDGLARSNNFGATLITNTHCVTFNGAPVFLGYWPFVKTSPTTSNFALIENCTVQSCAPVNGHFGIDLYTGDTPPSWSNDESLWTANSPYSMPASFTNSIIKLWMDGNDADPKDYGFYNITVKGLSVEGPVPISLFCIGNLFYPFNGGVIENRAGNASSLAFVDITCEQTPAVKSRLIGRDRSNTPHDITFKNITIAGELLTTWNWNEHVVQDSSPYNIFVEGRLVTTAVDVCNTALAHLGETANVSSVFPPDGSAQAAICNRFYNVAVEELLTLHPWSFATKRTDLTEDVTNDLDQSWGFSYQVPGDVGRVLQVIPQDTPDNVVDATTREQPSHTLEQDAAGDLRLYSNIEDAVLRYTTYVYDANKYPALFVSALSWLLASKLAGPLIKGDVGAAEAKRCLQMVQWYIGKAVAVDGLQRNQKPTHSVPWISQR